MKDYLIPIQDDLFDVAARLKSVNPNYAVYYNKPQCRYEVHCGDALAFVVPYSQLDARTVEYARKTSVQNAAEIIAEMERNNDYITKQAIDGAAKTAASKLASRR